MIRRAHADNDVCYFGEPMIEGFISGDELSWNLSVERVIGIQFDISESQ
jgi:hypothetical protein